VVVMEYWPGIQYWHQQPWQPTNISAPLTVVEIMTMEDVKGNTGLEAVVEVFDPAVVMVSSCNGSSGGGLGLASSDGGLCPFAVLPFRAGVEVLALAAVPQVLPSSPGTWYGWWQCMEVLVQMTG